MSGLVPGNDVRLLRNGTEYFPALEKAIDDAREEVYLESYIFEADEAGEQVGGALQRAAIRGVSTHLLIDGFGSRNFPKACIAAMERAGVEVLLYRPETVHPWLMRHRLRRLHRKLCVVDAKVGFIGGINIIHDLHTPGHKPPRYDYAVRIEGPVVAEIQRVVRRLWAVVTWSQLKERRRPKNWGKLDAALHGGQTAQLIVRDNLRHRRDIEQAYLGAIDNAKNEILIASPYFLPGLNFRRSLVNAAARGVRVILLLQARVEYVLMHFASRALYGAFLDAGVEIWHYHKSFMHAKVAVIDRAWATVGSSNIDPFSLLLAREANLVIEDERFARELRADLERAVAEGATRVFREGWRKQPLHTRIITWLSYGLSRLMTGIGYGWGRE
ncbi:MAG: cardiolipin synthase ClsB [Burkholderiales bacterium]